MASSAWIIDVTESNFDSEVMQRSKTVPVMVDFWAPWCGPCQQLGPILEKLVEERGGEFILAKVNVDEAQELAAGFRIEGIPAVKVLRNAQIVAEFVGLRSESDLRELVDQICPGETDKQIKAAAELEKTAPAEAEALLRGVLQKNERHPGALLGLARLALDRGDETTAETMLGQSDFFDESEAEATRLRALLGLRVQARPFGDEPSVRKRLDAEPKNARIRFELGCVLASKGQYREALEALLAAGEIDPKLASTAVRETMVKVFQVIGVRSELADEYRGKLSRMLY